MKRAQRIAIATHRRVSIQIPKTGWVSENTALYSAEPAFSLYIPPHKLEQMLAWSSSCDVGRLWTSQELPQLHGLEGPLADPRRPVS